MADSKATALTETSVPALDDIGYVVDVSDTTDGAGGSSRKLTNSRILGLLNHVCQGRLTLTSGTAVTTADVIGATSVYFTPYTGQCVALYDGTRWRMYTFSELTLALGTLTNALPYDVFLYDNSGTLTLELLAWTNGTTRATALVLQDGVYCKTGALTRRYLGTFYTTATTTTEDSEAKRFLWNYYNRSPRPMHVFDTTDTWTYNSATWHSANASTANRLQVVIGVAEAALRVEVWGQAQSISSADHGVAIGEDSTSSPHANCIGRYSNFTSGNNPSHAYAWMHLYPAVGFHFYQWIERVSGSQTITFYGDNGDTYHAAGIGGVIQG